MEYSEELRGFVYKFIAKQQADIFTKAVSITPEMAACVLVQQDQRLQLHQIVLVACRFFPIISVEAAHQVTRPADIGKALKRTCAAVLRSYDFNFEIHRTCYGDPVNDSISESSARALLLDHSHPRPPAREFDGENQLDRLPGELLVAIYKNILILNDSGIMLVGNYDSRNRDIRKSPHDKKFPRILHLITRDPSEKKSYFDWCPADPRGNMVNRPDEVQTYNTPFPSLLNVLLVNKATKAICSPIFYGGNRFHGNSPSDLIGLLLDLSPERLAMMRKVSFIYRPSGRVNVNKLLKMLANSNITSVGIGVRFEEWNTGPWLQWERAPKDKDGHLKFEQPDNIEGMRMLCKMSFDEILIEGTWQGFAECVREKGRAGRVLYNGEVVRKAEEEVAEAGL